MTHNVQTKEESREYNRCRKQEKELSCRAYSMEVNSHGGSEPANFMFSDIFAAYVDYKKSFCWD